MRREPLSLAWFIEDVEATAVEHQLEGAVGRRRGEKISRSEAAAQSAPLHLDPGALDCEWRDIDSKHIETAFGQPKLHSYRYLRRSQGPSLA